MLLLGETEEAEREPCPDLDFFACCRRRFFCCCSLIVVGERTWWLLAGDGGGAVGGTVGVGVGLLAALGVFAGV